MYIRISLGLEIDHEAFIIELSNGKESFVLRANKPRNWVKLFHESIEEAERTCNCKANRESQVGMTPIFGGKVSCLLYLIHWLTRKDCYICIYSTNI